MDIISKRKKDKLVSLIMSLTKAEKRHFRLMSGRQGDASKKLYLQLFDYILKKERYDVVELLKHNPQIKSKQLANVKMNLYKQIMSSLRLLHRNNIIEIQLREQLDYARILYNKGLYEHVLEILYKTKERALSLKMFSLSMEILEFEKLIESQHITGSMHPKAEELAHQSLILSSTIRKTQRYSNSSLQLYGYYLQFGYIRNDQDYELVTKFLKNNIPKTQYHLLSFFEKLYLNQSYVWYYTMVQNFALQYKYAVRWIDLFNEHPIMIKEWTSLYLKGFHNVLISLFMNNNYNRFVNVLQQMEVFVEERFQSFNQNERSISYLFLYIHRINKHFLSGSFKEGLVLISPLEKLMADKYINWDSHRIMVFHYKIACLYYGANENEKAIFSLNKIIHENRPDFRVDIQCFARIINLIAHFDLGNELLVSYQIKSVYRFLAKMDDVQEIHKEIFKFLRKTPNLLREDFKNELAILRDKLILLREKPYQRRPFFYLDIISWIEGKIQDKHIGTVIAEKFQARQLKKT